MSRLENYKKEVEPRIALLIKKKFHLEAFYLCSASIEYLLQEMISHQEDWISILVKKSNLRFSKTSTEDLENKTLGQLIAIFSRYCTDDKLISELKEFNSFRKKIVHHLLDHSIEELNMVAKKKIRNYYLLVSKLFNYGHALLEKKLGRVKREIKMIKSRVST